MVPKCGRSLDSPPASGHSAMPIDTKWAIDFIVPRDPEFGREVANGGTSSGIGLQTGSSEVNGVRVIEVLEAAPGVGCGLASPSPPCMVKFLIPNGTLH